jgi:hypothetical protein
VRADGAIQDASRIHGIKGEKGRGFRVLGTDKSGKRTILLDGVEATIKATHLPATERMDDTASADAEVPMGGLRILISVFSTGDEKDLAIRMDWCVNELERILASWDWSG